MSTTKESRLYWLEVAIGLAGSASELANRAGLSNVYLSQVRNQLPDSKTGKSRGLGSSAARKIERALNKPDGWMDQPRPATQENGNPQPVMVVDSEIQSLFARFHEQQSAGRLSPREVALLKALLREMLQPG